MDKVVSAAQPAKARMVAEELFWIAVAPAAQVLQAALQAHPVAPVHQPVPAHQVVIRPFKLVVADIQLVSGIAVSHTAVGLAMCLLAST